MKSNDLGGAFNDLRALTTEQLLDTRYERYRHLGVYEDAGVAQQ